MLLFVCFLVRLILWFGFVFVLFFVFFVVVFFLGGGGDWPTHLPFLYL